MSLPGLLGPQILCTCSLVTFPPVVGFRKGHVLPEVLRRAPTGTSAAWSSLHTGRPLALPHPPPTPKPPAHHPPPGSRLGPLPSGISLCLILALHPTVTCSHPVRHLRWGQLVFLGHRSQHGSQPLLPSVSCSSMLNPSISPVNLASKIYS